MRVFELSLTMDKRTQRICLRHVHYVRFSICPFDTLGEH